MPLQTPPKIPALDILRNLRITVNTVVDTLIVDGEPTDVGFKLITSGGDELEFDLSGKFLKRGEVIDLTVVPPASETQSGRLPLSTPKQAVDLTDDTSAMTPAKVGLALQSRNLPKFNADVVKVGELLFVESTDDGLVVRSISIKELCKLLASAGCGGSGKTVKSFDVLGPDSINEPEAGTVDVQYTPYATFSDGTVGILTDGIVCSIIATAGETIDSTGKVTIRHDNIPGNDRQITVRIGYRLPGQAEDTVKSKVTKIFDPTTSTVTLTPTGKVKYYEAAATESNPELAGGWKGSLDGGGCDKVSGWIAKLDNLEVRRAVDLTADGVLVAQNVPATITRPDVWGYLKENQNVPGLQNQVFGYEWTVPASLRKGKQIVWRAYVAGTQTELSFSPRTSDSCVDETNHPPVLAGNFSGSHEYADCEATGGWVVNLSNLNISPEIDVEINGVVAATVQAYGSRPDVAGAVGSTNYDLYQWRYMIPDRLHNGAPLVIRAKIKGTNTLLTFSPQTTDACASQTPTVLSRYITKPNPSITEAGMGMQLTLMERMSSGPDRACPDAITWRSSSSWVAGILLSAGGVISCPDGVIDGNVTVYPEAVVGNDVYTTGVQVLNVGCTRSTAGYVNVRLIYNFQGANSNSARLFTSLDDANNTMGAHYDGTQPGTFNAPYLVQLDGGYTIGTPVWFGDGQDCTKSDDGIRFSIDSTGGNTQVTAIRIANGLIAERKTSTYQTPVSNVAIGNPCKTFLFDNTTAPNSRIVLFEESTLNNVTGLLAHFRVNSFSVEFPTGVGLRGKDLDHGMALMLYPDTNHVQFVNQGVAFGQAFPFTWEVGKSYWIRMQYFDIGNSQGRILAAIWPDTQPETNVVYDWSGFAALSGYPLLYGGSRSGSGSTFDKLYAYGCGNVQATDYKAYVDHADCNHVDGWLADSLNFNTPITLPIYVDGVKEGTVTATAANPGVSNVYGWNNTTGHIYGFNWPLPAKFRDGQPHVITIRDNAGNLVSGNSFQMPACQPAQLVNSVAIYRRSDNTLAFLYKSPNAANQNLEDKWDGDSQDYLPSSFTAAPVGSNPAGYEGYQYFDSYGTARAAVLAILANQTTFSIRKIGESAPLLSFQFTAANLALGEVRVIYTAS